MTRAWAAGAALLLSTAASACPICFGGLDDKRGLAAGLWWLVVIMLSLVLAMIGAIGWTFWTIERRRKEAGA